jgi:MOSC domain-containing protein YiiM
MRALNRVHAIPGVGIEGDRYATGKGHWSDDRGVSRDLTLIEAEVVENLRAELGIALDPGQARRNLTTRGVRVNELVGRRFFVGGVLCEGTRLCEPCEYLAGLISMPVLRPLVHRGGLRAVIVGEGYIEVGDLVSDVGEAKLLPAGPHRDPAH